MYRLHIAHYTYTLPLTPAPSNNQRRTPILQIIFDILWKSVLIWQKKSQNTVFSSWNFAKCIYCWDLAKYHVSHNVISRYKNIFIQIACSFSVNQLRCKYMIIKCFMFYRTFIDGESSLKIWGAKTRSLKLFRCNIFLMMVSHH